MTQLANPAWKRDLWLLVLMNGLNHAEYIGARFTMLLFAVKLQASPALMGMLIAVNSLLPTLTSVQIGRWLDRRTSLRRPMLAASLLLGAGVLLPFFWGSIPALFVMCVINGTSFAVFRIATQQLIGRLGGPEDRAENYTHYSMALAVANFAAPLIAGFSIDHTGTASAFLVCFALGLLPSMLLLCGRVKLPDSRSGAAHEHHPGSSWDLLGNKPLRRVLIAGMVLMAAWDVFSFMMPLYGSQLQFSASQIGMCAGAFYAGSFFIRIWIRMLLKHFTSWQLLLLSMAGGSVLFSLYPFLDSFPVLVALSFILGSGIGLTQPMTMSLSYDAAPAERKGEVIGLRLTLTASLQIVIPLLSGALGTAFGLEVAYWFAALTLLLGCWTGRGEWHRARAAAQ